MIIDNDDITAVSDLKILSFSLQFIIIYYWVLRDPSILGNGHIFFAGIINDVIMGLPLGTSPLTYLVTSFIAIYIKNVTVKMSLFTDWFTFILALFFANLTYLILISNFSDISITYLNLFYNSLFTFLFYPLFWVISKRLSVASFIISIWDITSIKSKFNFK